MSAMRQQLPEHTRAATNEAIPFSSKIAARFQSLRRNNGRHQRVFEPLPQPSQDRLDASLNDTPIDTTKLLASQPSPAQDKQKTVLYLAYGSNLCDETFRGVRGIQPLSQTNVLVPSLRLTFDLPGIPYKEPCFANTALRPPPPAPPAPPSQHATDYHKDRWHKGLVGVVYEVTLPDYAHIIATEGGGSAYTDILVDCHVLAKGEAVPCVPSGRPFRAHTLFAPLEGRAHRPDPAYAQPSARYLKLISDGAAERELPAEYRAYLRGIRPYTITRTAQMVGAALFLAIWLPVVMLVFAMAKYLQDERGRAPGWFAEFSARVFGGMWMCYDGVFRGVFGEGERTVGDGSVTVAKRARDGEKVGLLEDVVDTLEGGEKSGWSSHV